MGGLLTDSFFTGNGAAFFRRDDLLTDGISFVRERPELFGERVLPETGCFKGELLAHAVNAVNVERKVFEELRNTSSGCEFLPAIIYRELGTGVERDDNLGGTYI